MYRYKKYFPEHVFYFLAFLLVSFFYIINDYASLAINDDWALWGMLKAKGIYNTFVMSYPLSYVVSHLYDFFPSWQWYSILLTLVILVNFYLWARYIQSKRSYIQKILLFVLALLWLTFLWFNTSITILTVTTMISAVALIRVNLVISFAFILLASLLRTDIMLIMLPYYIVSYFILRDTLQMSKQAWLSLIGLIVITASSLYIQKQDQEYQKWLGFTKVRSAIVDSGVMHVKKDFFTQEEWFCVLLGWWQDEEILPTEKLIVATPTLMEIIHNKIQKIHFIHFIKQYKFKYWLWLLLAATLLAMILNIRNRRVIAIPLLAGGVILLLLTRDVERVTVPLIILWAYVLFESLRKYRVISTILLLLFTYSFYYYVSTQFGYRYFKENTALQKEARELIRDSNRSCEVSITFPTASINELNTIFNANYLFHEDLWMQLNDKEVLPGGWLSRHKFFYETHHISDTKTKRKYPTYYAYLMDDKTAFFGSRLLLKNKVYNTLLNAYDRRYLKERPECKHKTFIVKESKHFAISQIRVDCNETHK